MNKSLLIGLAVGLAAGYFLSGKISGYVPVQPI